MTAPIPHQMPDPDRGTAVRPALAHLRFTGVSDDGAQLRLVDEEGTELVLVIDDRLRAAVRPSGPATSESTGSRGMEKTMESTLRPRDIQSRIRAGETPETVAQAAGTSIEKIMPFAAPVLAEREHVAQRAQRSSVRRAEGPGGARTLGEAVDTRLRSLNVDPDSVDWDAWRREDGRWPLTAAYATAERSGTAEFLYDAPGNYVTLENDDARWLVGDAVTVAPPAEPVHDDLSQARQRRLNAVTDDELPLGDDAIGLVSEQPVEAFLDPTPPSDPEVAAEQVELREEAADAAGEDDARLEPTAQEPTDEQAATEPAHPEPPRREVKKTRGRASVPSWDEIMFGGGKSD